MNYSAGPCRQDLHRGRLRDRSALPPAGTGFSPHALLDAFLDILGRFLFTEPAEGLLVPGVFSVVLALVLMHPLNGLLVEHLL